MGYTTPKFLTQWNPTVRNDSHEVVMDDSSITEQQGWMTNQQMYEEMIRSGRILRAHRLGITVDEVMELEEQGDYETRYELDLVEQQGVLDRYEARLQSLEREIKLKEAENAQKAKDEETQKEQALINKIREASQTPSELPKA